MRYKIDILKATDFDRLGELVPVEEQPKWALYPKALHPQGNEAARTFWDHYTSAYGNFALISMEGDRFLGMRMGRPDNCWEFRNLNNELKTVEDLACFMDMIPELLVTMLDWENED